jgi:hypothetical protein
MLRTTMIVAAALLMAAPAVAQTKRYNCVPYRVTASSTAVRVLCAEPKTIGNDFRQGFPLDGGEPIQSFAMSTAELAKADRFAFLANFAQTAQLMIQMVYAPGGTGPSFGCTAGCRVPLDFTLFGAAPYRLPYTEGVTLFEGPNFTGPSFTTEGGFYEAVRNELTGVGNDAISSLKVDRGYRVVMCTEDSFRGQDGAHMGVCRFFGEGTYASLGADLENQVSLVSVFGSTANFPSGGGLWRDANFQGLDRTLGFGLRQASRGELTRTIDGVTVDLNDQLSSLIVQPGFRAVICSHDGSSAGDLGVCRYFGPGNYNLLPADLDDQVSLATVGRQ